MVVGCSYSSGANFTAGNDVEPGMFCGQAAARGATYRLVCGSEVTIYSVGDRTTGYALQAAISDDMAPQGRLINSTQVKVL